MQDPKALPEDAKAGSVRAEQASKHAEDSSPSLSRRHLFTGGFFGLLAQACSESGFTDGGLGTQLPKALPQEDLATAITLPPPLAGPEVVELAGKPETAELSKKLCKPIDNPKINPGNSNATPETTPRVLFYGRRDSALIAMLLPASLPVLQVFLSTSNGKLMAMHGISGADRNAKGEWRPIIIDNIALLDKGVPLSELAIIMQTASMKIQAKIPISFMTQFQNKPVVDLSGRTVPAEMLGKQSVAQFAESGDSFSSDNSVTYPNTYNTNTVRSLLTAKSSSLWTAGNAIRGTVTDIMGNPISIEGSNLLEYQVFCTYVATDTGGWARTMLHVG